MPQASRERLSRVAAFPLPGGEREASEAKQGEGRTTLGSVAVRADRASGPLATAALLVQTQIARVCDRDPDPPLDAAPSPVGRGEERRFAVCYLTAGRMVMLSIATGSTGLSPLVFAETIASTTSIPVTTSPKAV